MFLSADFRKQDMELCGVKFFFLLFCVNETHPQMEHNSQPYMAILGGGVILMIKFNKHTDTY